MGILIAYLMLLSNYCSFFRCDDTVFLKSIIWEYIIIYRIKDVTCDFYSLL